MSDWTEWDFKADLLGKAWLAGSMSVSATILPQFLWIYLRTNIVRGIKAVLGVMAIDYLAWGSTLGTKWTIRRPLQRM